MVLAARADAPNVYLFKKLRHSGRRTSQAAAGDAIEIRVHEHDDDDDDEDDEAD